MNFVEWKNLFVNLFFMDTYINGMEINKKSKINN
ncbi:hypothetical protein MNBD_BACTEROID01-1795 [hydrothermal vent metagenome]|uniref:Uncharacterized protein n=1 Tax=hydrothermal vent metagenome TaxID=652676 RepID=A0A3B0TX48_9ZZZZ